MPTLRFAASLSLCSLLVALPAAALIIDDFEEGDFDLSASVLAGQTDDSVLEETSGHPTANVVGGVRLVSVFSSGTLSTASAQLATTAADDGAALTYVGDSYGQFDFVYDGKDDDAVGFVANSQLGLDLSGFDSLVLNVTGTPLSIDLQWTLWTSTGFLTPAATALVTGDNVLDLTSLAIDLSDIQGIRARLSGFGPAGTVTLNSIEATAVPEPGTALLLCFGLVALGARRGSRSRSA